jgi:hypothetical protein
LKEMVRTAREGLDVLLREPLPLFGGSLAWTLLNVMTPWLDLGPLLLGPALLGMFHVALKALRGRDVDLLDNFVALREPATPLVAGVLFALPFSAWSLAQRLGNAIVVSTPVGKVAADVPGVPMIATLSLLVFFGVYVFVFPFLADGTTSLADAVRSATKMAEQGVPANERFSALGRQLSYAAVVFLALMLGGLTWRITHAVPFIVSVLVSPAAICVLASWYLHRISPRRADDRAEEDPADDEQGDLA